MTYTYEAEHCKLDSSFLVEEYCLNHNMKKIVIIHGHIFINGLWYIAGSDLLLKGVVCFSETYVLNSVSRNHIINYGTPIFFQGQYKALYSTAWDSFRWPQLN